MPTDHDLDRALQALARWDPAGPTDDAWRRITARRRARTARGATVAIVAVVVLAASGLWIARDPSGSERIRTTNTTLAPVLDAASRPIADPLPPALDDGRLRVEPAGPYTAGQVVRLAMDASIVGDWANDGPRLCFSWGDAETCDPAVWEVNRLAGRLAGGDVVWILPLPGWVVTPGGPQPCVDVGCRATFLASDGARVGTPVLEIDPGPRPADPPVSLTHVGDDGSIELSVEALVADDSWLRAAEQRSDLLEHVPPVGLALCVFEATGFACDGLVEPPELPFDGTRAKVSIAARRELFTQRSWQDCARFTCVVLVTRSTGVLVDASGNVGSSIETVAQLPYLLPQSAARVPRPRLVLEGDGTIEADGLVTVVLEHPPVPSERLTLGQCSSADLAVANDCRYELDGWEELPDGSLRATHRVQPCRDPDRCYLAVTGAPKGYPAVATVDLVAG